MPADGLRSANARIELAVSQAKAGDLAGAQAALAEFHTGWETVEDSVREQSPGSYAAIERAYDEARDALTAGDALAAIAALEELGQANEAFIDGRAATTAERQGEPATLAQLLPTLAEVSDALAAGSAEHAAAELESFRAAWPDVEGDVKARSADIYRSSENDLAAAAAAIKAGDLAGAQALIAQLRADLEPMAAPARYGVFDAFSILLREGLEALLVIAALLAFLERTGNHGKRIWIWGGGLLGVAASVGAGLAIAVIFRGVATGGNRELIEGISGLIAAAMLFGVSFWLHSKSHVGAWQKYIHERTSAALATGSLLLARHAGLLRNLPRGRRDGPVLHRHRAVDRHRRPAAGRRHRSGGAGGGRRACALGGRAPAPAALLPRHQRPDLLPGLQVHRHRPPRAPGGPRAAAAAPDSCPTCRPLGSSLTWQTTLPQLVLLGVALVVVVLEQVLRRPAAARQAV